MEYLPIEVHYNILKYKNINWFNTNRILPGIFDLVLVYGKRIKHMHDHTISMNGGGQKARYFASVGYFDQVGTTIGTDLKRINTRIKLRN